MKGFFKYKKELLYSFLLFLMLVSGTYFYFFTSQQKELKEYEKIVIQENKTLLETVRKEMNRQCDTIFDIKINQPHVLQILNEANNQKKRDAARQKLYKLLKPTYILLQKNGIRQFHFHLPGSISFLRFHKVDKFGDSLKGIRYSIELVNKTKKIVRGFEEGRIFNGFRNVYPLFYHGKFIGTVEISYSIRALAEVLSNGKDSYYGLLISKRVVDRKVWSENRHYYLPSLLSQNYLWDKEAFRMLYGNNEKKFLDTLQNMEKSLRPKIQKILQRHDESFLIPLHFKNRNYIAIFQLLKNIESKPVGYITTLKENNVIALRISQDKQTLFISYIVIFIFTLFFFLFLKSERDIKEKLSFTSNYDPLTKLLNRRGYEISFKALLQSHKRNPRPFALLFLDIDHFKKINDTYGHNIGDKVLQKLAELLQEGLRGSDIIARWGGEEFVVTLDNTDANNAKNVAEKLRRSIERYNDKNLPRFTISIGVIQADEHESLETLIKKVDTALYKAKKSGRNKVELYSS